MLKKWATCLLAGLMTSIFLTTLLVGWEKQPTQEEVQTQELTEEESFSNALSPFARRQFEKFSAKQKQLAMDLADGNKVEPDAAVGRISAKR